jgi:hypothetical protein
VIIFYWLLHFVHFDHLALFLILHTSSGFKTFVLVSSIEQISTINLWLHSYLLFFVLLNIAYKRDFIVIFAYMHIRYFDHSHPLCYSLSHLPHSSLCFTILAGFIMLFLYMYIVYFILNPHHPLLPPSHLYPHSSHFLFIYENYLSSYTHTYTFERKHVIFVFLSLAYFV